MVLLMVFFTEGALVSFFGDTCGGIDSVPRGRRVGAPPAIEGWSEEGGSTEQSDTFLGAETLALVDLSEYVLLVWETLPCQHSRDQGCNGRWFGRTRRERQGVTCMGEDKTRTTRFPYYSTTLGRTDAFSLSRAAPTERVATFAGIWGYLRWHCVQRQPTIFFPAFNGCIHFCGGGFPLTQRGWRRRCSTS